MILDLLREYAIVLKRVSSTSGGEYAGPCPFCGGNDRFRVWPEHKGGRYWCRGCQKTGDEIQLLRDLCDLSYSEACERLGIETRAREFHSDQTDNRQKFSPRRANLPAPLWSEKAAAFVTYAKANLWSDVGSETRSFLFSRGLHEDTIKLAELGLNPADMYRHRPSWGLQPTMRPDGRPKKLWIPAGLVIPCTVAGRVIRLRIRRSGSDSGSRYIVMPGSTMAPLILGKGDDRAVIVESELDSWLIFQEAGDLVRAIAIGSVSARPDHACHEVLKKADPVLIALDSDGPGARESWHFWRDAYPGVARRWPVPIGKDPSDALQKGLDIRTWIMAGIESVKEEVEQENDG